MKQSKDWKREDDLLLGTAPDADLAEQLGCSLAALKKRRNNFGIPAYRRAPTQTAAHAEVIEAWWAFMAIAAPPSSSPGVIASWESIKTLTAAKNYALGRYLGLLQKVAGENHAYAVEGEGWPEHPFDDPVIFGMLSAENGIADFLDQVAKTPNLESAA